MGTPNPLALITAQQVDVAKAPAPVADYIAADDQLYIRSICSVASVVIRVTARLLRADGLVIIDTYRHLPNSNRTAKLTFHPNIEGYLLSLNATVEATTVRRGQCFLQVGLARGTATNPEFSQLMISDYISSSGELGYPYSLLRSSLDGPGYMRVTTGSDPAANAEFTETVPTGARWRLISVLITLVTDGNAANRIISLLVDDGATVYAQTTGLSAVAASTTAILEFCDSGYAGGTGVSGQTIPVPAGLTMLQQHRFRSSTNSRQVGDNYGAPVYLVEEWLEL